MSSGWQVDASGLQHIHEDIADLLERVCSEGATNAVRVVPVDTGDLMHTIDHEVDREALTGYVFAGDSDVDYAYMVEKGTSRTPAQPYLVPGVMRARGEV